MNDISSMNVHNGFVATATKRSPRYKVRRSSVKPWNGDLGRYTDTEL